MQSTITGTMTIAGQTYEFTATPRGAAAATAQRSAAAAPPAATDGELPPLPDRYETCTVKFDRCGEKGGQGPRGPWTRWYCKDQMEREGDYYSTFHERLGAALKRLAASGGEVLIAYTETERGKTFVGFPPSDETVRAPAATKAAPAARSPEPTPAAKAKAVQSEEYDPGDGALPF